MCGKCIKVVNGIFFLLVIVFDVNMNREAVEQHQQKVNKIYFDFLASPVIVFIFVFN
jgi:fumarate reductase subunit C